MVSPSIIATLIGIAWAIIAGGIGYLYRRLQTMEKRIDTLERRANDAQRRSEKMMGILFGREKDSSDDGVVSEIDDGFDNVEERIENMDDEIDDVEDTVRIVVFHLDEADGVEIDKEDIWSEASLMEYDSSDEQ